MFPRRPLVSLSSCGRRRTTVLAGPSRSGLSSFVRTYNNLVAATTTTMTTTTTTSPIDDNTNSIRRPFSDVDGVAVHLHGKVVPSSPAYSSSVPFLSSSLSSLSLSLPPLSSPPPLGPYYWTTMSRQHVPPQRRWFSDNNSNTKSTADGSSNEEPPEEGKGPAEDNITAEQQQEQGQQEQDQEQLENQVMELQKQNDTIKDQLLRALAEQENIRTIARRDVDAAKQFSIKSFAKSLLDVADNLDRALSHVDKTQVQTNPALQTLVEGIEMTSTGLTKALESNGVKSYCHEPGDVFDPTLHEALMEYNDPTKPPGTVGLVMKKGYMLHSRVLRPAEVGVVKK